LEKKMARIAPVVSHNHDLPNAFATLANARVALDGYLALSEVLSRGHLSARRREILALAIAQENECQYCLSAHTEGARALGLSLADTVKARSGSSDDPYERAFVSFTKGVVRQRGLVSDRETDIARKAGIDDGLMLEIVANVALHTLTNYANRLADTEIDSPLVEVSR
jgi:AhpD family alkylhydroperoxidase